MRHLTYTRNGDGFVFRKGRSIVATYATISELADGMALLLSERKAKRSFTATVVTEIGKHREITLAELIATIGSEITTSSACAAGRRLRKSVVKKFGTKRIAPLSSLAHRGRQSIIICAVRNAIITGKVVRIRPGVYAPSSNGNGHDDRI